MKVRLAAALAVLILATSPAFAAHRFVLTQLGPIDGAAAYAPARAINNHRQIVCTSGSRTPLFLWEEGSYTNLGIRSPQYGATTKCTDINDAGQVAGTFGLDQPCIWQNGAITDLGVPLGMRGAASGINELGQVVGWYKDRAFLWENGTLVDITPPEWSGAKTYAYSINNNGVIVGRTGNTGAIWSADGVRTLNPMNDSFCEAMGVNEDGVVVGWRLGISVQRNAFMYRDGVTFRLHAFDFNSQSRANAVNGSVQIVGYSYKHMSYPNIPFPGISKKRACMWEDGVLYDLNDLIEPELGLELLEAWDINDGGDIVGEAFVPSKGRIGFLLTPWLVQVDMDVCPGVEPNQINLNAKQPVPVAVFSADGFNPFTIDHASVRFAGARPYRTTIADANRDGRRDLVFWFRARDLELYSGEAVVELSGETRQGRPFRGTDRIAANGGDEAPMPLKPSFRFEELPLFYNASGASAYAINDRGQIAGKCSNTLCIWENGTIRSLYLPDSRRFTPVDINNSGQIAVRGDHVVGKCLVMQGTTSALVEIPDADIIEVSAINDSGTVIGNGYCDGGYYRTPYAFAWQDGQGAMLYPRTGANAYDAEDINDAGLIVGYFIRIDKYGRHLGERACAWVDGSAVELPLFEGAYAATALAVNNSGTIVGNGRFACVDGQRPFIWRDGVPQTLAQMEWGSLDSVTAINDWGQITGRAQYGPIIHGDTVGALWHCGTPYDLNRVTTGVPEEFLISNAIDINNNQQIICFASGPNFTGKTGILTPVPAQVTIDIRPGDPRNMINTRSRGLVPVMVYSGEGFATASLLPETVTLAGAGAQRWQTMPDTNGDGLKEMLFMFPCQDLNLSAADTEGLLNGRTFDGWWIEGRDKVDCIAGKDK